MYKFALRQTYPRLVAFCKSSVVAIGAGRHFVVTVESEVKAAVGTTITTLSRLFAGADFVNSCHITPPCSVV